MGRPQRYFGINAFGRSESDNEITAAFAMSVTGFDPDHGLNEWWVDTGNLMKQVRACSDMLFVAAGNDQGGVAEVVES